MYLFQIAMLPKKNRVKLKNHFRNIRIVWNQSLFVLGSRQSTSLSREKTLRLSINRKIMEFADRSQTKKHILEPAISCHFVGCDANCFGEESIKKGRNGVQPIDPRRLVPSIRSIPSYYYCTTETIDLRVDDYFT
jgi:hypothetical protein